VTQLAARSRSTSSRKSESESERAKLTACIIVVQTTNKGILNFGTRKG